MHFFAVSKGARGSECQAPGLQNTMSTGPGCNQQQCTVIHPRLPEAGEQTNSLCLSESYLLCSELDRT